MGWSIQPVGMRNQGARLTSASPAPGTRSRSRCQRRGCTAVHRAHRGFRGTRVRSGRSAAGRGVARRPGRGGCCSRVRCPVLRAKRAAPRELQWSALAGCAPERESPGSYPGQVGPLEDPASDRVSRAHVSHQGCRLAGGVRHRTSGPGGSACGWWHHTCSTSRRASPHPPESRSSTTSTAPSGRGPSVRYRAARTSCGKRQASPGVAAVGPLGTIGRRSSTGRAAPCFGESPDQIQSTGVHPRRPASPPGLGRTQAGPGPPPGGRPPGGDFRRRGAASHPGGPRSGWVGRPPR